MRALLVIVPLVLASCADTVIVSKRQILKQAKAEVALREPWAADAVVMIDDSDPFMWHRWKVRAGVLERSGFRYYKGLDLVPETQRVLWFTREGCLASYRNVGRRCYQAPADTDSTGILMVPEK